ncbi:MAG TPA: energy transducer TonB [Candidatus Acidoferrales bacterium]|nr:energy transducer TonB [Candidatus Acidoferrales bacterium]
METKAFLSRLGPTLFAVLLGSMAIGSAPCLAQQGHTATKMFTLKTKVPLSAKGQLQIDLNAMPSGGEYIIGINRTNGESGSALVGDTIMGPSGAPMNHPIPVSLTDWNNIETTTNSIQVNGLDSLHGILMMLARVPPGTTVTVNFNGQLVTRVICNEDVIIQNGIVSTESKVTMATLATKLMFPDTTESLPEVIQPSPGSFVARSQATVAHIVSYTLPAPSATDEIGFVKVVIDEAGNVTSATTSAAYSSDAFDQACREAVSHWKFRPFYFNGKAVSVMTGVSFISMQHIVQMGYTH